MLIDFSLCVLVQDSFSHFKIQGVFPSPCWKRSPIGSLSHSSGAKWISAPRSICFWSLLTGRKIGTLALSSFQSRHFNPAPCPPSGQGNEQVVAGYKGQRCAGQETPGRAICSGFRRCVHVCLRGVNCCKHGGRSWTADRPSGRRTSAD